MRFKSMMSIYHVYIIYCCCCCFVVVVVNAAVTVVLLLLLMFKPRYCICMIEEKLDNLLTPSYRNDNKDIVGLLVLCRFV